MLGKVVGEAMGDGRITKQFKYSATNYIVINQQENTAGEKPQAQFLLLFVVKDNKSGFSMPQKFSSQEASFNMSPPLANHGTTDPQPNPPTGPSKETLAIANGPPNNIDANVPPL